MSKMSLPEQAWCRSWPWRSFAARVLRPGGVFAGYDLVQSGPARVLHVLDRSPHRLASTSGIRAQLGEVGFSEVKVSSSFGGTVARFRAVASRS